MRFPSISVYTEIEYKIRYFNISYILSLFKKYENSQTINFIDCDNIYEVTSETYYKKQRLYSKGNNIKLSISDELPINKFPLKEGIIRAKNRFSMKMFDTWRMDLTFIYTTTDKFKNIKNNKEIKKLFSYKKPYDIPFTSELEFEYVGNNDYLDEDDIEKVYDKIKNILLHNKYDKIIYRIAEQCKKDPDEYIGTGLKKLINQVYSMDYRYYHQIYKNIEDYYITQKYDGVRSLIMVDHIEDEYYAIGSELSRLSLFDLGYKEKRGGGKYNDTILDCEYYNDIYYAFDILVYKGEKLIDKDYSYRLKMLQQVVDNMHCMRLIQKQMWKLDKDWSATIQDVLRLNKTGDKDTDGIIFTPNKTYYDVSYKWKPAHDTTIDFFYDGKYLYNGIDPRYKKLFYGEIANKYSKVRFDPTLRNMKHIDYYKSDVKENNIIELSWENNDWHMYRVRDDRKIEVEKGNYFGNDVKIADLNWQLIHWNVSENMLTNYKHYRKPYIDGRKLRQYMHDIKGYNHIIDYGEYMPHLNKIVESGVTKIDIISKDPMRCIDIITQKYGYPLLKTKKENIQIYFYTNENYLPEKTKKTKLIAINPSEEQNRLIKLL